MAKARMMMALYGDAIITQDNETLSTISDEFNFRTDNLDYVRLINDELIEVRYLDGALLKLRKHQL